MDSVIYKKDSPNAPIAWITINRPHVMNACDPPTTDHIYECEQDFDKDPELKVLVLTGAGDRAFCTGMDLKAAAARIAAGGPVSNVVPPYMKTEKVTIAARNGYAVAGGLERALACDIRIASTRARFMVAYLRIGLFPGFGGTWLLPRVLGSMGKAAEMLFTGDFMEAEEGYRLGFLNHLVDEDELESTTMEMARKIAAGPPIAIRLSKLMLYKGLEFDLDTALKMAAAAETITLTSYDHGEGTRAIRESRKP